MTPRDHAIEPREFVLAAALIGLAVAARLLPHAADVSPLVATALLGGMLFRGRPLALLVPVLAMGVGDLFLGFYDWRVMAVVYAATVLPALLGRLARPCSVMAIPALALASSLGFFAATNFAVWAFAGMYSRDLAGLAACYVAALPFLKNAVIGDLAWTIVLFGGWWMLGSRRFDGRTQAEA